MDLPNEIIFHILTLLVKCDLKSSRLVSKAWTAFATELLFDQVYVSAHPENLEVFRAITQHALLSKCVKKLRYDAVDFVENYTKEHYIRDLWLQTGCYIPVDSLPKSSKAPHSDSEIKAWMALVKPDPQSGGLRSLDEIQRACKDYEFIDYGYQKYKRYASLERVQSENGTFVESLVEGLQKLENLSYVVMEEWWPSLRQDYYDREKLSLQRPSGSPLARNWNIFHTKPKGWQWNPDNHVPQDRASDGADHYWAITCALLRSQRKIQTFVVSPTGVPAYCFDRTQRTSLSFYGLDVAAFLGLKKLDLCIANYGIGNTPKLFPNMNGLRFLLGSMPHLVVLYLTLPGGLHKTPLYAFEQVFPQQGQWSKLTTLSLQALASSATDFLTLLVCRMPSLTELELGNVELLTGSWEGVIECMMQSMHLLKFDIPTSGHLRHCGGTSLYDLPHAHAHRDKIKRYVEKGGTYILE